MWGYSELDAEALMRVFASNLLDRLLMEA
jgi:hypothetical protein